MNAIGLYRSWNKLSRNIYGRCKVKTSVYGHGVLPKLILKPASLSNFNHQHSGWCSYTWFLNNQSNHLLSPQSRETHYSSLDNLFVRHFSTDEKSVKKTSTSTTDNSEQSGGDIEDKDIELAESQSIFQRFKNTYKRHGKVLVGVHVCTSVVWFGSFYYAVSSGIDVIALLEWIGLSEKFTGPLRTGGAGNIAVAYLLYKVATPARYTVTLAGTNFMIKHLRKTGKMPPVPEGERIRELYKDSKEKISSDLKTKKAETMAEVKEKQKQIVERIRTPKK